MERHLISLRGEHCSSSPRKANSEIQGSFVTSSLGNTLANTCEGLRGRTDWTEKAEHGPHLVSWPSLVLSLLSFPRARAPSICPFMFPSQWMACPGCHNLRQGGFFLLMLTSCVSRNTPETMVSGRMCSLLVNHRVFSGEDNLVTVTFVDQRCSWLK